MRLWSTLALALTAVVCILTGVGLQTVFRPAATVHESLPLSGVSGTHVAVIGAKPLTAHVGDPVVTVEGTGEVYVAAGPARDVAAWQDTARVTEVQWRSQAADGAHLVARVTGSSQAPSPIGSDLWVATRDAHRSAALRVDQPERSAVIVTAEDGRALPRALDLSWSGQPGSPWALPLILAGGAALIGAIVLAWSMYASGRPGPRRRSHRRANGAHRAGRRRGFFLVAAPLTAGLLLATSGCTGSAPASPSASGSGSAVSVAAAGNVVVSEPHFRSILGQIAGAAKAADAAGNASLLAGRFAGPALAQRTTNYEIRAKYAQQPLLPTFPTNAPEVFLPQSSHAFPRTVFVIFSTGDNGNPQAVLLQQADARSNYQVISDTMVVPGARFPALPPASEGTTVIDNSTSSLLVPPGQLVARYAAALGAPDSPDANTFSLSSDIFATMTREDEDKARQQLGGDGVLEISRTQADAAPVAISAQSSGAVVAVDMNETWTWRPAQQNGTISLSDDLTKAVLGKDSTTSGVQEVFSTMLLFHVPASGSGHATLLGYQQAPVSIKEL